MPRPQKCRRICREPAFDSFQPDGIACGETIQLSLDEYEVIRLVDYQKLTHEQCAARMDISRSTVTDIYENARYKLADCLLHGKRLLIGGGCYRLCNGSAGNCHGGACPRAARRAAETVILTEKGDYIMRIAVTYENGQVFQHFGHTEQFKVYDVKDGKVVSSQVVDTAGQGHGALAGFLYLHKVDALICGGIGGGAQMALADAGIHLFGGVRGSADEAVDALLAGTLGYDPNVHCDHHGHGEGEHRCGPHGQGEGSHGCSPFSCHEH